MLKLFNGNKKITEQLYRQNLELAVINRTLSLLERLYQTSILTLTPEEMAREITDIIRKDLNLEFAGILIFEKAADFLKPLAFSKSERLIETLNHLGFLFHDITITDISKRRFLKEIVYDKQDNATDDLEEIWEESIKSENLREIKKESNIKTVLLHPLIINNEVFGVLLLGFNRDYKTLNNFEKESIKSFINVIALLLDKANLYKSLQDSYEVAKKAYAVEKQAKEELEKLDKIKNQFLAQTEHDLRTPLGIIRDYCDLLLGEAFGKLPKKSLDVIKRMQTVAQNKIKDVNNFLDTTQFQLGKKVVSLKAGVQLSPILEEIIKELNHTAEAKGIYLKLEKPLGTVPDGAEKTFTIEADREKLKSAIFNIIDNSIKYTLKGGVIIKVQNANIAIQNDQSNKIIIEVRDTGIGIPAERIKTLFDTAFERSKEAQKASPTGRGIGLYLSSQIIKAHNGRVWAQSEGEQKGSIFYIELPVNDNIA